MHTPLQRNDYLSEKYGANIYFKREDLQHVRSFKLRGAYYKIKKNRGRSAQYWRCLCQRRQPRTGCSLCLCPIKKFKLAFLCLKLHLSKKIDQVRMFGREYVEIILAGDTFDDSAESALSFCEEQGKIFIHPFDDFDVIAGQGTVAVEIMNDMEEPIDYVFGSIGGGGLMSGVSAYIKNLSPSSKIIGVEPAGAGSMKAAFAEGGTVALDWIDKFVDGAAVKCVGHHTYDVCRRYLDDIILVPEGKVCTTILDLYNKHAIIAEPAGALSVAALDFYKEEIKGKSVVVIISGGNNDIGRMQEIKEKSLIHEGLLYYFIVSFPQRAGALRQFLTSVLGPNDDITTFEYTKKNNKESGPALVGIELGDRSDYEGLLARMNEFSFKYKEVNNDIQLFGLLV
ncbi:threonine ammonia-lyase IlvA [Lysinibacillus sp. MHQ-1]|nr:threonine ammonia-lyase IlvA [Lysinibacillus sp. MHQ-1]